jgi:3-isopropylmalate dehydrogenase
MRNKELNLAIFPGDGIGIEIIQEALKVLKVVSVKSSRKFNIQEGFIGGAAYDLAGNPLPEESMELAGKSDAVLLGAVGGPKWENLDYKLRPERALLGLRKQLGLFANLRPVVVFDSLIDTSTLKSEIIRNINIMIVRELTGDVYFGTPRGVHVENGNRIGINTMIYSEEEIRRIAKVAFEIAQKRGKNLVSVDKANVLESTQLWRDVVTEVSADFPDVTLRHMYVDNCAMQLIRNPLQFDVILTTNMFGDILSDEASMLTGSIGMLPSASLGRTKAMYEPIHGSAPDIAGKNIANPLAAILSVALMLRVSFDMPKEAEMIEKAVTDVLEKGLRTPDICQGGTKIVSTETMGEAVVEKLKEIMP